MVKIRQLLAFLFVLVGGLCILTWAGWYNYDLDFIDLAKNAKRFPMGPAKGPLAVGFGMLFLAWIIHPGDSQPRRSAPPQG